MASIRPNYDQEKQDKIFEKFEKIFMPDDAEKVEVPPFDANIVCSGVVCSGMIGSSIIGNPLIGAASIYDHQPPPSIIPPAAYTEKLRFEHFEKLVADGLLRKNFEPMYDTLVMNPSTPSWHRYTEHNLFTRPVGQDGTTHADTNMMLSGQLGTPLWAKWEYLHIHFELYHSREEAIRWMNNAEISLVSNWSHVAWRGSPGMMTPILPRGGKKMIDRKIKTGIIKFWPWLEAPLEPRLIESTDGFSVRVQYKEPMGVSQPMRIKFALGPNLYRPY